MGRTGRNPGIFAGLIGLALCTAPGAETVHTWVDARGVRHFSQYPPTDPAQSAETLQLEPLPAASDADARLRAIRDVSRDLERAREQRELERARGAPAERAPAPRAEPPSAAPAYVIPYPYAAPYPPVYPPYRPRPHPRPGTDEPEDSPIQPGHEFTSPGMQVRP